MAFFEDLGNTLSSKGKEVAAKAKEMSEVVSLNNQVATKEKALNQAYITIGKKYYQSVNGVDTTGELTAEFATIAEALQTISELKKQIQDIKGIQFCASCGAENDASNGFCSKCGAKLIKPEAAPTPTEVAAEAAADRDPMEPIHLSDVK